MTNKDTKKEKLSKTLKKVLIVFLLIVVLLFLILNDFTTDKEEIIQREVVTSNKDVKTKREIITLKSVVVVKEEPVIEVNQTIKDINEDDIIIEVELKLDKVLVEDLPEVVKSRFDFVVTPELQEVLDKIEKLSGVKIHKDKQGKVKLIETKSEEVIRTTIKLDLNNTRLPLVGVEMPLKFLNLDESILSVGLEKEVVKKISKMDDNISLLWDLYNKNTRK